MSPIKTIPLAAATLALSAGLALGGSYGTSGTSGMSGEKPVLVARLGDQTYLVNRDRMTLYTFDKDGDGVSNCYGDCAVKWPPLLVEEGAPLPMGYALVARKDGSLQVAWHGQPLYTWFKDQKPGDMTGDGVKGVWHVARP